MTRPGMRTARAGNVIPLRPGIEAPSTPFDQLTARLVLARHREGTLPEGIVAALLAGVGVRP
ncbi:hypothetical protein SAMN02990966_07867 [Rhodospirillales bacterium URHD0017]|nr:hypothetical protein SAMN02990966_07867 [Rhodospirillales bacterium URHD0017]